MVSDPDDDGWNERAWAVFEAMKPAVWDDFYTIHRPRLWPTWALLLVLWIGLVLCVAVTVVIPEGPVVGGRRCPDDNGACIYDDDR